MNIDIIVAGNLFQSEIETGRADAGTGHVIINQGDREMKVLSVQESGLYLGGDVKSLYPIRVGNSEKIIVGINKGPVKMVSFLPN